MGRRAPANVGLRPRSAAGRRGGRGMARRPGVDLCIPLTGRHAQLHGKPLATSGIHVSIATFGTAFRRDGYQKVRAKSGSPANGTRKPFSWTTPAPAPGDAPQPCTPPRTGTRSLGHRGTPARMFWRRQTGWGPMTHFVTNEGQLGGQHCLPGPVANVLFQHPCRAKKLGMEVHGRRAAATKLVNLNSPSAS